MGRGSSTPSKIFPLAPNHQFTHCGFTSGGVIPGIIPLHSHVCTGEITETGVTLYNIFYQGCLGWSIHDYNIQIIQYLLWSTKTWGKCQKKLPNKAESAEKNPEKRGKFLPPYSNLKHAQARHRLYTPRHWLLLHLSIHHVCISPGSLPTSGGCGWRCHPRHPQYRNSLKKKHLTIAFSIRWWLSWNWQNDDITSPRHPACSQCSWRTKTSKKCSIVKLMQIN